MIKDQQRTCIVEASDHQPRAIPNCPYNAGDTLIVAFKKGTAPIEKYYLMRLLTFCAWCSANLCIIWNGIWYI